MYGLTECAGAHSFNTPESFKLGSVGQPLHGHKTKPSQAAVVNNTEVCLFGRHVFMGYLGLTEKTAEIFDEEGYLRTGDVGRLDPDGYLFIAGRCQELISFENGENVFPPDIESRIKSQIPIISHAMVVDVKRSFLCVLLTLKTEVELSSGRPCSKLTESTKQWAKQKTGETLNTVEDARSSVAVRHAVQKGLDDANLKATSTCQEVRKFEILPVDFSIAGGELGPTSKLIRPVTAKKYLDVLESFCCGDE